LGAMLSPWVSAPGPTLRLPFRHRAPCSARAPAALKASKKDSGKRVPSPGWASPPVTPKAKGGKGQGKGKGGKEGLGGGGGVLLEDVRRPERCPGLVRLSGDASERQRGPRHTGPVNLVLIGGRGCGKSSISRRVAAAERRFVPLAMDDLIRYEARGRTIPEMVEADGWGAFRDLEHEVAQKCGSFPSFALIDCGGGVVVDLEDVAGGSGKERVQEEVFSQRKLEALRGEHGALIVYVERDVSYLSGRVAGDTNRPDLSAVASFEDIVRRREPWYLEFCDAVLDGRAREGQKKVPKKDVLAHALLQYYYWETGIAGPAPKRR